MSKTIYNIDTIVYIEIFKFKKCKEYTYVPEKKIAKFFGLFKKTIPSYIKGSRFNINPRELPDDWTVDEFKEVMSEAYFIKDQVIYVRPRVEIGFCNDMTEIKYFKTDKECEKFVEKIIGYSTPSNFIEF